MSIRSFCTATIAAAAKRSSVRTVARSCGPPAAWSAAAIEKVPADVQFVGERTREERDAELREAAIDVED